MLVKRIIWIAIIVIVLITIVVSILILTYFFKPLFLRRSYIESLAVVGIPRSAEIIDYRLDISSWGIRRFYAKLRINQEDYEILRRVIGSGEPRQRIKQDYGHIRSLNIENVEEIGWRYRLTGQVSMLGMTGTSRTIDAVLVKEDSNNFFLYIFHN